MHAEFATQLRRMPGEELRELAERLEDTIGSRGYSDLMDAIDAAEQDLLARTVEADVVPSHVTYANRDGQIAGLRYAARWMRAVIEINADRQTKSAAAAREREAAEAAAGRS